LWCFRRPTHEWLAAYQARQAKCEPTFSEFADGDDRLQSGYRLARRRAYLGDGDAAFEAARRGLQTWQMMPSDWVQPFPLGTPIQEGSVVVVLVQALGVWWPNACRIVRSFDQRDSEAERFGFVYATLPGHVESGQEMFVVTQDDHGRVWYEVVAHSRPRYWAARLLWPIARLLQRRFVRDSLRQMQRFVVADSVRKALETTDSAVDRAPSPSSAVA